MKYDQNPNSKIGLKGTTKNIKIERTNKIETALNTGVRLEARFDY
jgi:hypothetical protein